MVDRTNGGEKATVAPPLVMMGCGRNVGHYLWSAGLKDRGLTGQVGPWKTLDSKAFHPESGTGDAKMTWEGGWTALGICDHSVDTRPGSHATFAVEGTFSFSEMYLLAQRDFPTVIDRIRSKAKGGDIWLTKGPTHPPPNARGGASDG